MGSEGPLEGITVNITGFKKFHGVPENPTEIIVENLKEFVSKRGLPKGLTLGSCNILETVGEGALVNLYATLQSAIAEKRFSILWVHFGVNSGATKFTVEQQAVNEATFRCPDEMGWKPQKEPIIKADGEITHIRETSLPVNKICEALSEKGFDVMISDDAGRFVCNYVYYHSLHFAEQSGTKSLFVHVPLFSTINEETQMLFAATLLEVLASLC
ncbi:hypothetical protein MLD38_016812 [Melastoma candidum]|uniref:Uncharacterized protein n=1 Tax=Melastoma candidum TaxID=119954 RepID=A0ACB9QNJ0_9MYRT|nr:hypothetical protein MLD38_016812 [Melastoma candidum]